MGHKLTNKLKPQRGFTLIELIVVLAISGLLAAGASGAVYQLLAGNSHNANAMTAIRNVQQTGHWISQDFLQGNQIVIDNDPENEQVAIIYWVEYISWKQPFPDENDPDSLVYVSEVIRHRISYTLSEGILERKHEVTEVIREDEESPDYYVAGTTQIARFIDSIVFIPSINLYKVEVTSIVEGFRSASETRVYDINKRPA